MDSLPILTDARGMKAMTDLQIWQIAARGCAEQLQMWRGVAPFAFLLGGLLLGVALHMAYARRAARHP